MDNLKPKNPVLEKVTTVFDKAYYILLNYSKFVLLAIVLLVSTQVISRKFLGTSIRWTEEMSLFCMVWMAFISMSIGVQKHLHIAISFFFNVLPKSVAKWVAKFDILVVCSIGVLMVIYGTKLVNITMHSTLPATHIPVGFSYIMIPVGGVFIVYFTLLELFDLERYEHPDCYQDEEVSENV